MVEDNATRLSLKAELVQRIERLELHQSLFPNSDESIDKLVRQLEIINPITQPLASDYLPFLFGEWELIYTSNGTVVTRQLASIQDLWKGIEIKRVWQSLTDSNTRKISASNRALLKLPILGEWQLEANGYWKMEADEKTAKVSFNSFAIQVVKPFGLSNWSFPQLNIPVLEFLQKEAFWLTSYLDEEIRIGRGATNNLFVFRRDASLSK
ncbi:PAP fibrillin [Nostoc sp. NIES-4103]|nr:PAP fibrillin [Nostoc sp. NIES-4103]